jgi:hypothetical protein
MAESGRAPSHTRRVLIDRIMGGNFEDTLRRWRSEGYSYDLMRAKLYALTQIEISRETLRRWCGELGMPTGVPADDRSTRNIEVLRRRAEEAERARGERP